MLSFGRDQGKHMYNILIYIYINNYIRPHYETNFLLPLASCLQCFGRLAGGSVKLIGPCHRIDGWQAEYF